MFKILNDLTPPYLKKLIPPQVQTLTPYPVRNSNNFRIPKSRTQFMNSSFIPATLRQWNSLDPNMRNCRTLVTFKSKIKSKFKPSPLTKLYSSSFSPFSKYHTQLRLGLSKLNAHLFSYGIIPEPFCPNCPINTRETSAHYLLECPAYDAQREEMFRCLRDLLPPTIINNNRKCVQALVNGIDTLSFDTNKNIFSNVQNYISLTLRFTDPT